MRFWLGLALLACVTLAGCADNANRSDSNNNNRFGGFYGGVSGGAEP